MTMMMPEQEPVRYTPFNADEDDEIWMKGLKVLGESTGLDDFWRFGSDWGNPDVSFWDRAKSLGTGLGELGLTVASFIPFTAPIAAPIRATTIGAKALPILSRAASSPVGRIVVPATKGEAGLTAGALGTSAASGMLPEDSPLQPWLMAAGIGALGGYGATKYIRGRRIAPMGVAPSTTPIPTPVTQTPVTGQMYTQPIRTLPGARLPGAATTAQSAATPTPAAASVSRTRRYNPLVSPKKGRVTPTRLGILAGLLGTGGAALWALAQGDGTPAPSSQLTPEMLAQLNEQMRMDPSMAAIEAANERYDELLRMGQEQFAGPDPYAERALRATADHLASLMNYGDARSPALQQAYERIGARMQQGGGEAQAAAATIQDMYNRQSRRTMREGRQAGGPAGESPTGGLVPVDASLQEAAQAMRQEGGSLADWLGEYGSITDRLLAERGRAAAQRGRREAQYLQDKIAMQAFADERNLELALAEREAARQDALRNWMFEIEANRMSTLADLENAALQSQIARQANLTPETIMAAQAQWDAMDDQTRQQFAQYGIVDAPSYINYALLGQLPPAPTVG